MTKIWERQIAIFFIVTALVGLLICVGLLIQAYIIHKPAFELLAYSSFKSGSELLRYYSILLFSAGCLALLITSNISKLGSTSRKLLSYISAFSGIVLLLFSFRLLFISYQPRLEWWKYFPMVSLGTSSITMTFSTLISAEQKRLRSTLNFISYILMLAGFVLIFSETINVDTIAANVASL